MSGWRFSTSMHRPSIRSWTGLHTTATLTPLLFRCCWAMPSTPGRSARTLGRCRDTPPPVDRVPSRRTGSRCSADRGSTRANSRSGCPAGRSVGRCRSCGSRLVRCARQCRDRRIGVHSPRRNQLVGRSNLFRDIRGTDSCPGDLRTRAGRRRTCGRRAVVLGSRPTDRSTQRCRSNCMSARAFRRHDRWALSTDRNDDRPLPTSR